MTLRWLAPLALSLAIVSQATPAFADPPGTNGSASGGTTNNAAAASAGRTPRARGAARGTRARSPNAAATRRTRATGQLGRRLTHEERTTLARTVVEQRMADWVPGNQELHVRPGMISPNTRSNPVTGEGLINVFTTQTLRAGATRWQRFRHFFNPYRRQRFVVNVSEAGEATILAFRSEAFHSRLVRLFGGAERIRDFVRDLFVSRGAREGLVTAAAGVGALMAGQPAVAGAAAMRAIQTTVDGVQRRVAARIEAVETTVRWARASGRRSGQFPTVSDAYSHYQTTLERIKPGTRPVQLEVFADQFRGLW